MQKLLVNTFILIIISIIFSSNLNAFEKRNIVFKNGRQIICYVLRTDYPDSILVKYKNDSLIMFAKNDIKKIQMIMNKHSIGFGNGVPYATYGISANVQPVEGINLSGAVGTTILAGFAWSVGLIVYPFELSENIFPRISVFYGTNAMLDRSSYYSNSVNYEAFQDFNIGLGGKYMFSEAHGITFDIIYLFHDNFDKRVKELELEGYTYSSKIFPVTYSLGYQYHF